MPKSLICRRHRLWPISDEIYHGLEYEADAETALAHSNEAIVINSFSKIFQHDWLGNNVSFPRKRESRNIGGRYLTQTGYWIARSSRAMTTTLQLPSPPASTGRGFRLLFALA